MRAAQKALGRMLPVLVHALRSPLSGLAMGVEVAAMRLQRHNADNAFLMPMRETLDEMSQTLTQLTQFVRAKHTNYAHTDACALVAQCTQAWAKAHPDAELRWHAPKTRASEAEAFALDPQAVTDALCALLDNAYEAASSGVIDVYLACKSPCALCITVQNAGTAVAPELVSRLKEPFYTTKHGRLGLGLALADNVACAHAGSLDIEAQACGTRVQLHLASMHYLNRGERDAPAAASIGAVAD